jgi:D-mannonate dehydratase
MRDVTHNAIIVVLQGLSVQEALNLVSPGYWRKVEEFHTTMRDLPPCGLAIICENVCRMDC